MIVRETVSHVPHEEPPQEEPPQEDPPHDETPHELEPQLLLHVLTRQGLQLAAQGAELQRLTR